ncbi:glyoxalase family protein [Moniliophthora roreri MCA 2997]|uniref:Glyoxalase family protein n=1 Tax=Moniliophthora roreri (strain MCA 2997) TaxID=1381753 RepID=V2XIQ4_MONRO|nr:glyoxalase family protein [Moniliophthora roreri MCA 2997]
MPARHTIRTDRVRILIFFERNPSISYEEFGQYWLHEHSKVFTRYAEGKKGLIKYEQLHINQEEKARLKDLGFPVLEGYDGVVLFDLESFDHISAIWSSPEYFSVVAPDEAKFCNRKTAIMVRLKVATIVDREKVSQTKSTSYYVREDSSRMMVVVSRKEGMSAEEFTEFALGEHARVLCEDTQMGKELIKYDQLNLVFPDPISRLDEVSSVPLPEWDGLEILDAPSFDSFLHPQDLKLYSESDAKWTVPGKCFRLPVNVATIIDNDGHHSTMGTAPPS